MKPIKRVEIRGWAALAQAVSIVVFPISLFTWALGGTGAWPAAFFAVTAFAAGVAQGIADQ